MSTAEDESVNIVFFQLFKIFGDSTRIRILYVLFESEMCVCDIAGTLDMTVSAISHQLRLLRSADLVRSKRIGKSVKVPSSLITLHY